MIGAWIDGVRNAYGDLNEREQRLVAVLGVVFMIIIVFVPLYLVRAAIASAEDANARTREVLRDIGRADAALAERESKRRAIERLYERRTPALGSFIEARARSAGYERPLQVNDQPEKVTGVFTRRHTRATLPGVGLRSAVSLLAEIENSGFPVAIERLHINHIQTGDRYNIEVGVFAFDKEGAGEASPTRAPTPVPSGQAGPPSP